MFSYLKVMFQAHSCHVLIVSFTPAQRQEKESVSSGHQHIGSGNSSMPDNSHAHQE
jgi:hypothetical protein